MFEYSSIRLVLVISDLFKILGSQNIIKHLWWHGDKQIYITTLSLLPSCNRTQKAHASNSESLLQLGLMSTDKFDVFLQGPHITTNNKMFPPANIRRIIETS